MQTDVKELRAAANSLKLAIRIGAVASSYASLADYILAAVREDDGEEQEDTVVFHQHLTVRITRLNSVWVSIDCNGDAVSLSFPSLTRRQFRALCEGLGIDTEEAGR